MASPVRYTVDAGIVRLVLCSATTDNAMDAALIDGLRQGLGRASEVSDCRGILIEAEGPATCSGLSLDLLLERRPPRRFIESIGACLLAIAKAPVPVVAVADGAVTGGGVGLVAACDVVIASGDATFTLSELIVGMIPALNTPFLLRRIGSGATRGLALSCRKITAHDAHVIGLVDEVTDDVAAARTAQLTRLRRTSPAAAAAYKDHLAASTDAALADQLADAVDTLDRWFDKPGVFEALRTFAEGFSPPWFPGAR